MEYNEIEIYIIDKLSNNTRISSKKLAAFYKHNITPNLSNGEMYSIAKKIEIPKCVTCEINSARFISFSKGYGKFCSKKCYSVFLSNSNIKNNSELSRKDKEMLAHYILEVQSNNYITKKKKNENDVRKILGLTP